MTTKKSANITSENSVDGKNIMELKVVELGSELKKRDLDKNGIKAVLMERLGLSIYFIDEVLKDLRKKVDLVIWCCLTFENWTKNDFKLVLFFEEIIRWSFSCFLIIYKHVEFF